MKFFELQMEKKMSGFPVTSVNYCLNYLMSAYRECSQYNYQLVIGFVLIQLGGEKGFNSCRLYFLKIINIVIVNNITMCP